MTTTTTNELNYDPYDLDTVRDPHGVFRRLREEAPLYYSERHDFYALSRFDDVHSALASRETFISGRGGTLGILKSGIQLPPGTVIFEDPPTHTMHRALLSRMFTPKRVGMLEPEIRRLCAQILDPLVGTGSFDFNLDIGKQLPMRVIGRLVGIPEGDQATIRDNFRRDPEHRNREQVLSGEIFAEYIDWRAEHPSDDIMTQLMYAEFEDETGAKRRLTRQELLAYVNIVAAAGNETTAIHIGWAGKLLADHPEQRRLLAKDPSLIPNAVEELLRFEPPALQAARYVARDIELHGQTVKEGSHIALILGAANRDDRQHDAPDRFDVRRPPGPILTFGFGSHYCLGQALARLEGRIVLEEILKRFPQWEVDWARAKFGFTDPELRGWDSLPVVVP